MLALRARSSHTRILCTPQAARALFVNKDGGPGPRGSRLTSDSLTTVLPLHRGHFAFPKGDPDPALPGPVGIYAKRDIPAGTALGIYWGKYNTSREVDAVQVQELRPNPWRVGTPRISAYLFNLLPHSSLVVDGLTFPDARAPLFPPPATGNGGHAAAAAAAPAKGLRSWGGSMNSAPRDGSLPENVQFVPAVRGSGFPRGPLQNLRLPVLVAFAMRDIPKGDEARSALALLFGIPRASWERASARFGVTWALKLTLFPPHNRCTPQLLTHYGEESYWADFDLLQKQMAEARISTLLATSLCTSGGQSPRSLRCFVTHFHVRVQVVVKEKQMRARPGHRALEESCVCRRHDSGITPELCLRCNPRPTVMKGRYSLRGRAEEQSGADAAPAAPAGASGGAAPARQQQRTRRECSSAPPQPAPSAALSGSEGPAGSERAPSPAAGRPASQTATPLGRTNPTAGAGAAHTAGKEQPGAAPQKKTARPPPPEPVVCPHPAQQAPESGPGAGRAAFEKQYRALTGGRAPGVTMHGGRVAPRKHHRDPRVEGPSSHEPSTTTRRGASTAAGAGCGEAVGSFSEDDLSSPAKKQRGAQQPSSSQASGGSSREQSPWSSGSKPLLHVRKTVAAPLPRWKAAPPKQAADDPAEQQQPLLLPRPQPRPVPAPALSPQQRSAAAAAEEPPTTSSSSDGDEDDGADSESEILVQEGDDWVPCRRSLPGGAGGTVVNGSVGSPKALSGASDDADTGAAAAAAMQEGEEHGADDRDDDDPGMGAAAGGGVAAAAAVPPHLAPFASALRSVQSRLRPAGVPAPALHAAVLASLARPAVASLRAASATAQADADLAAAISASARDIHDEDLRRPFLTVAASGKALAKAKLAAAANAAAKAAAALQRFEAALLFGAEGCSSFAERTAMQLVEETLRRPWEALLAAGEQGAAEECGSAGGPVGDGQEQPEELAAARKEQKQGGIATSAAAAAAVLEAALELYAGMPCWGDRRGPRGAHKSPRPQRQVRR